MERNEAMPEAEKLVRISRQFGVSTDYLLLEEAEEPEAPKAPAAAAGLWGRIKQWYRNKGYLLAWVLAAWGGVRLLRESVDLRGTPEAWSPEQPHAGGVVPGADGPALLNVVPAALMAAAGAVLAIRGRRMAETSAGITWAGSRCWLDCWARDLRCPGRSCIWRTACCIGLLMCCWCSCRSGRRRMRIFCGRAFGGRLSACW